MDMYEDDFADDKVSSSTTDSLDEFFQRGQQQSSITKRPDSAKSRPESAARSRPQSAPGAKRSPVPAITSTISPTEDDAMRRAAEDRELGIADDPSDVKRPSERKGSATSSKASSQRKKRNKPSSRPGSASKNTPTNPPVEGKPKVGAQPYIPKGKATPPNRRPAHQHKTSGSKESDSDVSSTTSSNTSISSTDDESPPPAQQPGERRVKVLSEPEVMNTPPERYVLTTTTSAMGSTKVARPKDDEPSGDEYGNDFEEVVEETTVVQASAQSAPAARAPNSSIPSEQNRAKLTNPIMGDFASQDELVRRIQESARKQPVPPSESGSQSSFHVHDELNPHAIVRPSAPDQYAEEFPSDFEADEETPRPADSAHSVNKNSQQSPKRVVPREPSPVAEYDDDSFEADAEAARVEKRAVNEKQIEIQCEAARKAEQQEAARIAELERLEAARKAELQRQEEAARIAELERQEAARKAELERQAEAARIAELERQEAARKAELQRQEAARELERQEAARKAELQRQEEAARIAELERQEAARKAELERQAEAARIAELERLEAARKAELQRQEDAARIAELERQEAARKAELQRQEDAARIAELERQEAARKVELQRQEEAARIAELERQEAARKAELQRQEEAARIAELERQEAARKVELQRQEEAARIAELERQEAARKAELERQEEAARIAELERQEAARKAELQRQEEAARIAELERLEAARKAELERQEEAARIAELERQEAARKVELQRQEEAARIAELERQEAARKAELQRQEDAARIAELERQEAARKAELQRKEETEIQHHKEKYDDDEFENNVEEADAARKAEGGAEYDDDSFETDAEATRVVKRVDNEMEAARKAEETARNGELERLEEITRKAELVRQEEAARIAELERQEAARKAELQRQEAARELERQEAARKAELQRQEDAARIAELERQEAARKAELQRQEEAARIAELERQEAARQAELERQTEAARKAELQRQQEAAHILELERQKDAARAEQSAKSTYDDDGFDGEDGDSDPSGAQPCENHSDQRVHDGAAIKEVQGLKMQNSPPSSASEGSDAKRRSVSSSSSSEQSEPAATTGDLSLQQASDLIHQHERISMIWLRPFTLLELEEETSRGGVESTEACRRDEVENLYFSYLRAEKRKAAEEHELARKREESARKRAAEARKAELSRIEKARLEEERKAQQREAAKKRSDERRKVLSRSTSRSSQRSASPSDPDNERIDELVERNPTQQKLSFTESELAFTCQVLRPVSRAVAPDPRDRHSTVLYNGNAFVFGGRVNRQHSSSLVAFHLTDRRMKRLSYFGKPQPVVGHAAVVFRGCMVIVGGSQLGMTAAAGTQPPAVSNPSSEPLMHTEPWVTDPLGVQVLSLETFHWSHVPSKKTLRRITARTESHVVWKAGRKEEEGIPLAGTDLEVITTLRNPNASRYHTAVCLGKDSSIYVFGGVKSNKGNVPTNTLDVLRMPQVEWEETFDALAGHVLPPPRHSHTAVALPRNDGSEWASEMLIFGGKGAHGDALNDLWTFSTETKMFEAAPAVGAVPTPRYGHAAVVTRLPKPAASPPVLEDSMLVFGGFSNDSGNVLHDLYSLSLETLIWRRVDYFGVPEGLSDSTAALRKQSQQNAKEPEGRAYMSLFVSSTPRENDIVDVIVFGGCAPSADQPLDRHPPFAGNVTLPSSPLSSSMACLSSSEHWKLSTRDLHLHRLVEAEQPSPLSPHAPHAASSNRSVVRPSSPVRPFRDPQEEERFRRFLLQKRQHCSGIDGLFCNNGYDAYIAPLPAQSKTHRKCLNEAEVEELSHRLYNAPSTTALKLAQLRAKGGRPASAGGPPKRSKAELERIACDIYTRQTREKQRSEAEALKKFAPQRKESPKMTEAEREAFCRRQTQLGQEYNDRTSKLHEKFYATRPGTAATGAVRKKFATAEDLHVSCLKLHRNTPCYCRGNSCERNKGIESLNAILDKREGPDVHLRQDDLDALVAALYVGKSRDRSQSPERK